MMGAVLLNNRYRIIDTLGRGGFGETYLTEDTHMPSKRKCVLKELKPIVQQPQIPSWMKERFEREAAILEELGEGNNQIPRLYAYFSENDKFYLVQEWIEGETLAQKWSREGNLNSKEVKNILIQLLPVLDYIHQRRIIHRDIKPENIIIRNSDLSPVLIDFGAVKEAMATSHNNSTSGVSASIGTPGYMPSEQAAGRPVYSSDLYSMGLTAIFLLTGKSPQDLEDDPKTGEIIWDSQGVAPDLVSVINKIIRFHPRDRFESSQEVLNALQNKSDSATEATLKVAPSPNNIVTQRTIAYNVSSSNTSTTQKKQSNLFVKLLTFFLLGIGIGIGTLATGVILLNQMWRTQNKPTPQVKIEPTKPKKVLVPPVTEEPEVIEEPEVTEEPEVIEEPKVEIKPEEIKIAKPSKPEISPLPKTESPKVEISPSPKNEPPEIIVTTKPQPEVKSEFNINIPIITTGTPESKLVSTLGQPSYEGKGTLGHAKRLVYRNVVQDRVNLTYHIDSQGNIRQTEVILDKSVSLGTMQNTLDRLLGGSTPGYIKEKLRRVYNDRANFSFFKVGNLEGKVQRDYRGRINISVWD